MPLELGGSGNAAEIRVLGVQANRAKAGNTDLSEFGSSDAFKESTNSFFRGGTVDAKSAHDLVIIFVGGSVPSSVDDGDLGASTSQFHTKEVFGESFGLLVFLGSFVNGE